MKFKSWNGIEDIELLDCPFCGCEPVVTHIGNDMSKTRSIKVKCSNIDCRCTRIDGAIKFGFVWLEGVAVKNWNKRVTKLN